MRSVPRSSAAFAAALFLLLLALCAPAFAPAAFAAGTDLQAGQIAAAATDEDVTWTYWLDLTGDAVITGYTLKDGVTEISIPETIDGYRVGGVVNGVFAGDTRLTKVTFPPTAVRLGAKLFENCTSLTYVDLTEVEELAEIPIYCFHGCTALTSVSIPASVTKIQGSAFDGCTKLKQVDFPASGKLDSIEIYAFRNCTSLESLVLPASLQSIGLSAFENCKSVASIKFRGSNLTLINGCAFKGCSALKELYLPDHVTQISSQAFANCTSLKVVAFGKELPLVSTPDLFTGCKKIELMIFPMKKNSEGAYRDLPDSDKEKVGWKKNVIPTVNVFYDENDNAWIGTIHATPMHRAITLPAKIGYHDIVRIIDNAANGDTMLTELVFPEDCKIDTIEFDAFKNCTSLKTITIPASVRHMQSGVFVGCTSLSSVTFETTKLESLGGATFCDCTSLTSITLPEGMTTLNTKEFYNCTKLKNVYLPDTMKDIGGEAFACGEGKNMAIGTMRMPDSSGDFNPPVDDYFFTTWIVDNNLSTFKFQVTYGSYADVFWLEPRMSYDDPQHYPIVLKEHNREYVPVAIGDEETHLQAANDVELNWDKVENWTGGQVIPEVTAKRWFRTDPVGGANFSVEPAQKEDGSYYDCKSVGKQKVKVTGNAPYFTGYRIIEYEITEANLDDVQMKDVTPACVWDNAKWEPDPEFYVEKSAYGFLQGVEGNGDGTYKLVKGQDYVITKYEHNKMAGTGATIWIEGKGNFKGKKSFTFTINPASLANTQVKVADQVYSGEAVTPAPKEVTLVDRSGQYTVTLEEGVDYKVDPAGYKNNTELGVATLKLVPVDGCAWLTGSVEANFNIVQADLSEATVKAVPDQVYTGADITPALDVSSGEGELVQDRDYTVTWENNRNVGTARATIKAKSAGCRGEQTITFQIVPKPVKVTPHDAGKTFGDADPELTAVAKGVVGSDTVQYSLARDAGEDAGNYAIKASGEASQGNYAVTFGEGTFTIGPASITDADVASVGAETFDGAGHEPEPVVTWRGRELVKDKDYVLSYADNVNAGQATVSVCGVGDFKDEKDVHFDILPFDLRRDGCQVLVGFQEHTGSALEPHPKQVTAPGRDGAVLTLEEGTDYTVESWSDNVATGTGHLTIRGKGNYCETREGSFQIVDDGDLSDAGYVNDIRDQTYTGGPLEPHLGVFFKDQDMLLTRDIDYAAEFADNVNVGTALVTVTGIDPLYGSLNSSFRILPADIAEATVVAPDQAFDGTAREPEPTVTWNEMLLIEGVDYEVASYANNVHEGTASVTVTGKGNFAGTAVGTFQITGPDPVYTLVRGVDGPVKQGAGAVVEFEFKRNFDDEITLDRLRVVKLNGEELPTSAYDTRRGSAIITLKTDYVDALQPGAYTLTAVFEDGEGSAKFTVVAPDPDPGPEPTPTPDPDPTPTPDPKPTPSANGKGGTGSSTGDVLFPVVGVLVVAAAGAGCLAAYARRRAEKKGARHDRN